MVVVVFCIIERYPIEVYKFTDNLSSKLDLKKKAGFYNFLLLILVFKIV